MYGIGEKVIEKSCFSAIQKPKMRSLLKDLSSLVMYMQIFIFNELDELQNSITSSDLFFIIISMIPSSFHLKQLQPFHRLKWTGSWTSDLGGLSQILVL